MPVTIKPSAHGASAWTGRAYRQAASPESFLHSTTTDEHGTQTVQPKKLLQSSFQDVKLDSNIYAAKNGLLHACLEAYNMHHRLIIRPEDVWFAILTQLSIFVNTHAEELRSSFVDHSGKVGLHIELATPVPLEKFDHGKLAFQMTKLMAEAIKDPSWREWILPQFTTTEKTDQTIASIIFMGTLQKYFVYSWGTRCGLPEVTLLGEASDWAEIRRRCVTRLPTLGKQCERWLRTLRPVLDGFVDTFLKPESSGTKRFWQGIVNEHIPNGSGTTTYSGWITAFCYWDEDGNCLHETTLFGGDKVRLQRGDIPIGFTRVPVMVFNGGEQISTEMIAGSVGIRVSRSKGRPNQIDDKEKNKDKDKENEKEKTDTKGSIATALDTVQPEVGWFMYTL
jgi:Domain of unknown function (DUF4419)